MTYYTGLTILFQDEHLVAVDKPAGLLVHRTDLDRGEREFAVQRVRDQIGQRVYPAHRLDRGTSGVLLFGLRPEVAQRLATAFERREVPKAYLAIVRGHPPESGEIDHALDRRLDAREAPRGGQRESAGRDGGCEPPPSPGGPSSELGLASEEKQEALTRYRRLATAELDRRVDRYPTARYALLELEPVTGRRHQLRRHLKHISHPVIGDTTYGKARHNRLFEESFGCRRLLLACVELRLLHPVTGSPVVVTAPLTGDFADVVWRLGWGESLPVRWLAAPPGAVG